MNPIIWHGYKESVLKFQPTAINIFCEIFDEHLFENLG